MKKYLLPAILAVVLLFVILPAGTTISAESAIVVQVNVWEQYLDVTFSGSLSDDALACRISNKDAEIELKSQLFSDEVDINTTIVLDVSASMPSSAREGVKQFLTKYCESAPANEALRLVLFGTQITEEIGYTKDLQAISDAVAEIKFTDQTSRIYDAIYTTLSDKTPLDGKPCFYRSVVITDGVDDTVVGITKEELYIKLQADTYPIDVVAVSRSKQSDPDKELSALTRMGSGRYFNLHSQSAIDELATEIGVTNFSMIRIKVPGDLLDGTTRQVDIVNGEMNYRFNALFPSYSVPATTTNQPETTPPELTESSEPTAVVSIEPTPEAKPTVIPPKLTPRQDDMTVDEEATNLTIMDRIGDFFSNTTYLILVCAGFALIVIIVVLLIVFSKKYKKKRKANQNPVPNYMPPNNYEDKTENLSNTYKPEPGTGAIVFRLVSTNNSQQSWEAILAPGVVITVGRTPENTFVIDDKSVSRQQCSIDLVDGYPVATNMSQTNITKLDGEPLNLPSPLLPGHTLTFGRIQVMIEISGSGSRKRTDEQNPDATWSLKI